MMKLKKEKDMDMSNSNKKNQQKNVLPQKKEKIPQTEKLLKLMIKASLSVAS
jgi:hypothetical protein